MIYSIVSQWLVQQMHLAKGGSVCASTVHWELLGKEKFSFFEDFKSNRMESWLSYRKQGKILSPVVPIDDSSM